MRTRTALVLLGATALAPLGIGPLGGGRARAVEPARAAEPAPPAVEAALAPPATTFELLAAPAQAIGDVGALLGTLVDRCPDDRHERDLDRARCRAASTYLRRILPDRTFTISAEDPAAISVSSYDEATRSYRLRLSACVACTTPLHVGRASDPVLVTLKKPVEVARVGAGAGAGAGAGTGVGDSLAAAVEIASVTLPFSSEAEARAWMRDVRPHLRAELVFSPVTSEWRFQSARGYAMSLIAGRIVDRCTGTVVLSSPPSTAQAERSSALGANDGCGPAARAAANPAATTPPPGTRPPPSAAPDPGDGDDGEEHLPSELSRAVIAEAMGRIRTQVSACYDRYRVPGSASLTYEVAGNGSIQSVRIRGALNGTPTGDCLLEAARGARFSRFDGPIQTFTYPFFLRR